jgi:hypothetical protein
MGDLIKDHYRIVINKQHSSHTGHRSRAENPDARVGCDGYYKQWTWACRGRLAVIGRRRLLEAQE